MFLQPAYQEDLLFNNVTQERHWNETCRWQCTDTLKPKTYDIIHGGTEVVVKGIWPSQPATHVWVSKGGESTATVPLGYFLTSL